MRRPVEKGSRLYVGNIPYETTEQDLVELFGQSGTVDHVKVVMDHDSGRSRGFGFVQMTTAQEAQAAIKALHQSEYGGRRMVVDVANDRPPPERQSGRDRGNRC